MSKLWVDLQIAWRSLIQHGRRTFLLGGALASVTALLILLNGLSTGVRETMIRTATTLTTGYLNIGGFFKVTAGQSAPVVTKYPEVVAAAKRVLPELTYTFHRGRGWAKMISETGSMQVGIGGKQLVCDGGENSYVMTIGRKKSGRYPTGNISVLDIMARVARR